MNVDTLKIEEAIRTAIESDRDNVQFAIVDEMDISIGDKQKIGCKVVEIKATMMVMTGRHQNATKSYDMLKKLRVRQGGLLITKTEEVLG